MTLLSPGEVRQLIAKSVPWIGGESLNRVTYTRLLDSGLLKVAHKVGRFVIFDGEHVKALIRRFPSERPPNRIGIVNWLKGERPINPPRGKDKRKEVKA